MIEKIKIDIRPIIEGAAEHKKHLLAYLMVAMLSTSYRLWLYVTLVPDRLLFFVSDILLVAAIFYTVYVLWQFSATGTELREARAARRAAEAASDAKSQFLANMSHEIRTPINAIIGMNEMIMRESRDKAVNHYAASIDAASNNLLALVNDILDFSKIESGRMEIIESDYNVGELINDLEDMFRMRADEKGVRLKFCVNGRVPKQLRGDPVRVKQICINLLSNAVKYTDVGEITFSLDWIREKDGSATVTIKVSDTGRGIKEEDLPELYDMFQRVDLKNNNNIEGTGLGLAITKTLVERMHGTISVESVYHAGSTFMVTIRQDVHDPEPLGDYKQYTHKKKDHGRTGFSAPDAHILAVDDTPMNLEVLRGLLKNLGSHIDTAESGFECIERVSERRYDVILMDARMPRMDGVETFKELKGRSLIGDDTKVLILTADAMAGSKERYIAAGFDDYLVKPIKPEDLEDAVRQSLPDRLIKPPLVKEDGMADGVPEWLYERSEINPKSGLVLCGTVETYMSTLVSFARYATESIEEMEEFLRNKDCEAFTIKIHALKSSAKLVGAEKLSEMALALEDAGNRGDMEYISSHVGPTFRLYGEIADMLKTLDNDKKEMKGVIEREDLPGLYRHLKEYVEDFNDMAVGSMLNGIGHYKFPAGEQERYEALVKAHDAVDWEEMVRLLEEF